MQELSKISGYSCFKIKQIIYYWLAKEPPFQADLNQVKYLIYDGTYFHKDGCLIVVFDPLTQRVLNNLYCIKEGYQQVYAWFKELKADNLHPRYVTMDGEQGVMRAFKSIWPFIKIQRCLFHIQREGCRWLRTYPRTDAAKSLKKILLTLTTIQSVKEQKKFIRRCQSWLETYKEFVLSLPMNIKANLDLKRTMSLINRALPDMFYYIYDPNIRSTSNILESFHGRIKKAYRHHCGLTHAHKIQFLRWYCFYENQQKINNS